MHDAMFERVSKSKTLERSKSSFLDDNVDLIINQDINIYNLDLREKKVLDFGCGVGRLLKRVRLQSDFCYGTDISPNMLKFAKEYIDDDAVKLVLCDDKKIPLDDDFFDLIYSFHVLQHIPTREGLERSLSEIYRVQSPDGFSALHFNKKVSEVDKEPGSFAGFRPRKELAEDICRSIGFALEDSKMVEGGSFILYLRKQ